MLALLDPRLWAAAAIACLLSYGGGRWQQWRADEVEHKAALYEQMKQARAVERELQASLEKIRGDKAQALNDLAASTAAAMQRLLDRPSRLPDTARAACAGSSGRELSREDSGVLVGLGDAAKQVVIELRACEARERTTFEALKAR